MYCIKRIKLKFGVTVQEIADILVREEVLATDAKIEHYPVEGKTYLVIPNKERQAKMKKFGIA